MATSQNKFAQLDKATKKQFAVILDTIKKIKNNTFPGFSLSDFKDVIDLRPGFKVSDGSMSNRKAIVFLVNKKKDPTGANDKKLLPKSINGIPTDVTPISPFEFLRNAHSDAAKNKKTVPKKFGLNFMIDSSDFDSPNFKAATEHISKIGYKKPPVSLVSLTEVNEPMKITCHVSPEEGWNQLKPFLEDVQQELRVGMYDYSAVHIKEKLAEVKKNGSDFNFVYDGKAPAGAGKQGVKINDLTEDSINTDLAKIKKGSFTHVKASLGNGGLFANAYHIKVAVKDKKAFWLSSGNWQSSNQPDLEHPNPKFASTPAEVFKNYNREWHVIIENKKLSNIYYQFLKWDEDQSSAHPKKASGTSATHIANPEDVTPLLKISSTIDNKTKVKKFPPKTFTFTTANPLKIQPVLTPDNYIEIIQPLIKGAKKRIFFQNQYITISKTGDNLYHGILTALKDKSNDPKIDARIILRNEGNVRLMTENLKNFKFDISKIKFQNNCHNKGIIIDDNIIILGSHNWSNSGVETNRDATLVIFNSEIQKYYSDVFLHDWDNMAVHKIFEDPITTLNGKGPNELLKK